MAKHRQAWSRELYQRYLKEGRGQGTKSAYKPWIMIHDFPSNGVVSRVCLRECDIKGRLHRFPDLRAFIDATIEEKEEWLTRRFMKIAENKKQSSENLTIADIQREMSLKPNTYRKYADFIENLIRKLNKGIHKS